MADPTDTTKPEDFWIQTLKTKAPLGLNVEYGLYFASLIMFMDGLFLDSDFRTRLLYYFSCCCCFVGVVFGFAILLLLYFSYYYF